MKNWMHISLYFKEVEKTMGGMQKDAASSRPCGSYQELAYYLKKVIYGLSPKFINRYFFLFEPRPHLFLALEVKNMKNTGLIKDRINSVCPPAFIESTEIELNSGDGGHPEAVVDFFHTGSKYAIYRACGDYRPGYENHDETKLVHCFCNQLFISPANEVAFHRKCLKIWSNSKK